MDLQRKSARELIVGLKVDTDKVCRRRDIRLWRGDIVIRDKRPISDELVLKGFLLAKGIRW
jgi:hypothetical protein